ncbi:MAG TPA: carboxypeptidase-like regulatory domain-containing protein [Candidatus Acidoferrales bacterium]|nr:carboxypeptidase-like regulatory domain-containing protein [Candidatus Acidoferrales bacterium]
MRKRASYLPSVRRVFAFAAIAALTACNNAVPPQQNYATVAGVITDGTSGQPISGATVTVDSVLTATTGSDGSYTIANVPVGPFTAVETAGGFQDHQDQGTVAAGDHFTLNATLYH